MRGKDLRPAPSPKRTPQQLRGSTRTGRCRHGYTSAARPDPTRAKNVYVREDQILPHLSALGILLIGQDQGPDHGKRGTAQITVPGHAAELIDHLRSSGITLTYDPCTRALRTETEDPLAVTVGQRR